MYLIENYENLGLTGEVVQAYRFKTLMLEEIPEEWEITEVLERTHEWSLVRIGKKQNTDVPTFSAPIRVNCKILMEDIKKRFNGVLMHVRTDADEHQEGLNVIIGNTRFTGSVDTSFQYKHNNKKITVQVRAYPQIMPYAVLIGELALCQGTKDALYIHTNTGDSPTICEQIAMYLGLLKKKPNISNEISQEAIVNVTNKFEAQRNKKLGELDQEKEQLFENIRIATQSIINDRRRTIKIEKAIEQFKNSVAITIQDTINELNKINDMPLIERISFSRDIFILYTKPIHKNTYISQNISKNILYGRFIICVNMSNGDIRIINTDFDVLSKAHPHVFVSGNPCLGNIQTDIASLIGSYELSTLTSLLLGYLEASNYRDIEGAKVSNWPYIELNDKGVEIIRVPNQRLKSKNKYLYDGAPYADYEANNIFYA